MGILINFPSLNDSLGNKENKNELEAENSPIPAETQVTDFYDKKQEHAFTNLLKEWPCYTSFSEKMDFESILEMYYDDELSVQQDYVLEYLFHMHDPKSSFDIANALYSWSEDDRNFFILSLNLHAEIIDQIKKQEY